VEIKKEKKNVGLPLGKAQNESINSLKSIYTQNCISTWAESGNAVMKTRIPRRSSALAVISPDRQVIEGG
jgi:hypothetical protein